MTEEKRVKFQFEDVRVEPSNFKIFKAGRELSLEPKTFRLLLFLIENRTRLIEKNELLDAIWKDTFVTENALTREIAKLRKALGDDSKTPKYIQTVHTQGYRFIAEVEEITEEIKTEKPANAAESKESVQSVSLETNANEKTPAETNDKVDGESETRAEMTAGNEAKQEEFYQSRPASVSTKSFWNRRNGVFIALLSLAALAGIVYFVLSNRAAKTDAPIDAADKTLAVLPFKFLSANDENDYLSVGLADSLITKLSNVRSLTVRPTSSVLRYAKTERDAGSAGRELKVETVIDGTIQQAGDRVRVSVQLVRTADSKPLWANSYDARFENIFQVQDEISARVVEALKIQLTGDEQKRLTRPPTDNIEAYQLYLRGNFHLYQYTPDNLQKALQFFNEAVRLDAAYALAYAGIANANGITSSFRDDAAALRAEAAAAKAVELDPTLAETHAALAAIFFWQKRDAAKARDSFNRALELNPNSSIVHYYYSWFLIATARFDEAEQHLRRALELDPLSPGINIDQGLPHFFARRYTEARVRYEQALKTDSNSGYAHLRLGEACEGANDLACAVSEFERAALPNGDSTVKAQLARALALAGKKDEARRILDELTAKDAPRNSPYFIALAFAALDEKDKAFENLNRALAEQDKWIGWTKVDPRLDSLRSDARFGDFLRRANLK